MKQLRLIIALILLLSVQPLHAERDYKSHYDVVIEKLRQAKINPKIVFLEEGSWTAKINLDYEKYIDAMATVLEDQRILEWYETPEARFLEGFFLSWLLTSLY